MQSLKNEDRLLIYCLRENLDPGSTKEKLVKTILRDSIDWDYLISKISSNGVLPLVWYTLNRVTPEYIPKTIAFNLQSKFTSITNQIQSKIIELKKLVILFKGSDIPIIPFKGAMLAVYYNDFLLRQWFDIDIVVHREDFNKSYELLVSNGYKPRLQHDVNQLNKFLAGQHSYPFISEGNVTEVDIHWSLEDTHDNDGIHFPIHRIFERHSKQTYFDIEIPVLNPGDLILSTCIHHGLRSNWCRLKYIYDFAILLNNFKELNWKEIISSAEKLNLKNSLLAGAFLANKLLGITVPEEVGKALSKTKLVKKIKGSVYKRLFRDYNQDEMRISNLWIRIFIQDNFYRRLKIIKKFVYTIYSMGFYKTIRALKKL